MTDQLACDINFFLYTRFVFGFYHEFQTSKRVRTMAKCYCCLVFIILAIGTYWFNEDYYPLFVICLYFFELLLYVGLSLIMTNKYLLQYYKKTPLIDASANKYKPIRVSLMVLICVISVLEILNIIISLVFYEDLKVCKVFGILEIATTICIIMGRLPGLFVFALLYTRVRLMRQTLENNNFDCRNQGKHHPRRYICMYEAIMDGLEKIDGPIKLQLFILMAMSYIDLFAGLLSILYDMKKNGIQNDIEFLWIVTDFTLSVLPLFLSAVLVDLVTLEVQDILRIVVDRRIASNNERDRAEIQMLFEYLKNNPFKYRLARAMPFNVHYMLSFTSSCVTTIIAILQINDWIA